jgi:hypothetical protein
MFECNSRVVKKTGGVLVVPEIGKTVKYPVGWNAGAGSQESGRRKPAEF